MSHCLCPGGPAGRSRKMYEQKCTEVPRVQWTYIHGALARSASAASRTLHGPATPQTSDFCSRGTSSPWPPSVEQDAPPAPFSSQHPSEHLACLQAWISCSTAHVQVGRASLCSASFLYASHAACAGKAWVTYERWDDTSARMANPTTKVKGGAIRKAVLNHREVHGNKSCPQEQRTWGGSSRSHLLFTEQACLSPRVRAIPATSSSLFPSLEIWKTHTHQAWNPPGDNLINPHHWRGWKEGGGLCEQNVNSSLHRWGPSPLLGHLHNCSISLLSPSFPPSAKISQSDSRPDLQNQKTCTDASSGVLWGWGWGCYFNM